FRSPGGGDRGDDRQCASQPERPRAPLDPAEAHSVKTAVTPTRPRSPTRSSRDARAHRPGPRPDPRDATLLGRRPPPRARVAALSHLRTLLLLPACLRIGMPVEVVFDDVSAEVALPRFRPAPA